MSEFRRVTRDSETISTAFEDIKSELLVTDNKIKTNDFLNTSKGVVTLVERFGKVFSPVTYDMNGNIRVLINGLYSETCPSQNRLGQRLIPALTGFRLVG